MLLISTGAIVDATADLVCAYKPNLAFYEALGIPGLIALEQTLVHIRSQAPHAIIIGDAKRGDIGTSSAAYARAMFQVWDFDAATVNPWGGRDTVEPFLEDPNRGVFLWCRGVQSGLIGPAGPGRGRTGRECSSVPAPGSERQFNGAERATWAWVLGATYPEQLKSVRRACPGMPFLIPGVGAQGGDLEAAVRDGVDSNGRRAIINSSRSIIYASTGGDFPEAARREAARLRDAINENIGFRGPRMALTLKLGRRSAHEKGPPLWQLPMAGGAVRSGHRSDLPKMRPPYPGGAVLS